MLQSNHLLNDARLQAAAQNNPPMVLNEQSEGVKTLQRALRDIGYELPVSFAHGDADGIYGNEVVNVVRRFQQDCKFPPASQDGKAGHDTLHALDALFLVLEQPVVLDTLKQKWFLDFNQPQVPFPPAARHPGSSVSANTDGNLVTPLIDGEALMRIWHDGIRAMIGHTGSELYHANWLLNGVHTLGQSNPASDALLTLKDGFAGGVTPFLLLSGHVPMNALNGASILALSAGGITTALIDPRYPNATGITTGSSHQKFYVLKDPVQGDASALIGSIDINTARWDRTAHASNDPERGPKLPVSSGSGGSAGSGGGSGIGTSGPTHDLGALVQGPAVADLDLSFRERWNDPTLNPVPPPITSPVAAPAAVGPHSVQVLHTFGRTSSPPGYSWSPTGDFTIWASYLNAIQTAQQYIYIEDQYFLPFAWPTFFAPGAPGGSGPASDIVTQLGEAIKRGVRVAVLVPGNTEDPLVSNTIIFQRNAGAHYLANVAASSSGDFVIAFLHNGTEPVYVHAKVMICDDEFATIGSANVNQRSMTHDTEINIGVVDAEGNFARELRKSLWEHHLGRPAATLHNFFTAFSLFKGDVAAGRGNVRPYSTADPGPEPFGHSQLLNNVVDPYGGPPR